MDDGPRGPEPEPAAEHRIVRLRRHTACLVGPAVALVVLAVAAGALVGRTPSAPGRVVLVVIALVLALRLVLVPFARWRATTYLLTDHRVAVATGVLHRVRRDVPLSRVEDVLVVRRPWHRLLGAGTVRLVTAGAEPLELMDVPRAGLVRETVLDAVQPARAGGAWP